MKLARVAKRGVQTAGVLIWLCYPGPRTRAQQIKPPEPSSNPATSGNGNLTLPRTVEDWTTLTLDKSELELLPPTPGEIDKLETYTRERWQVQWRLRDPLDLYIIKPVGVDNPPVILYLYSTETASKRAFINDGWCKRVTSGGFAAVAFVPALTEDRFQMRPMKEWFISELQESLGSTTHDVQMVLNYLELRKDLDVTQVGILGIGSGATVGILAAAADPRIRVLDLVNPWADWPNWLAATPLIYPVERKDFLTPEFEAKVAPLDPVKWLPKLTTQRMRIQLVDETLGERKEMKTAMESLEAAAPKDASVIHVKSAQELKNSLTKTGGSFQWVKDQLRPPAPFRPPDPGPASAEAQNPKSNRANSPLKGRLEEKTAP